MKFDKPIALAADHGGYELKEAIKAHLDELGIVDRSLRRLSRLVREAQAGRVQVEVSAVTDAG